MAKTYADLTVANATAGNAILASDFTTLFTNSNNYRVPPMCRAVRTSDTSYTSGQALTWQSVGSGDGGFDTDSMFSSGSATRITFKTAGVYQVTFNPYITGSSTTYGQAFIKLNGSTFLVESDAAVASTGTVLTSVSIAYAFAVNDYVEGFVTANGSGLSQKGTLIKSAMSAVWLGQAS